LVEVLSFLPHEAQATMSNRTRVARGNDFFMIWEGLVSC
jgi:hypothetical protein